MRRSRLARFILLVVDEQDFGPRLAAWRKKKGLTQKEAAELLGINPRTVEGWEQGRFVPILDGKLLALIERVLKDGF